MLVVDQPIGTGMNKQVDDNQMPKDFDEISMALLKFLKNFLSKYPGYTDIILSGESMAGTVHTWLAEKILQTKLVDIRLKSIFLISPWLSAVTQYSTMADYLLAKGRISSQLYSQISPKLATCVTSLSERKYDSNTSDYCRSLVDTMLTAELEFDKYHIQYPAKGSPYGTLQRTIREFVKSGQANTMFNYQGETSSFRTFAPEVAKKYTVKYLEDNSDRLRRVIDQSPSTKMLVLQGSEDLICNPPATELWLARIGAKLVGRSRSGDIEEILTTEKNVKMVQLENAGHFVCWHRPDLCYRLLDQLIGKPVTQI